MHLNVIEAYKYPIKLKNTRNSSCGVENLSADSPMDYGSRSALVERRVSNSA